MPHGCGAFDGNYVTIRIPPKRGSLFRDYKGFCFSSAHCLVECRLPILWIDVGVYGSMSDAQIYNEPELKERLEDT